VSVTPQRADFGPLLIATDIDDAAIATLQAWMATYLGQVEIERGLAPGSLPRPVDSSYANTLSDDEFPDHMLPAVLVTTAHTEGSPTIMAAGFYNATWRLTVSCVVRGRTPSETRANAALLEGSVRRVIAQQGSLGIAARSKWVATSVAPVLDRSRAGRHLAAGICEFDVATERVVQRGLGPDSPAPDPSPVYYPLAEVVAVSTEVDGVDTTEPFAS
jgi:hypothetical protein